MGRKLSIIKIVQSALDAGSDKNLLRVYSTNNLTYSSPMHVTWHGQYTIKIQSNEVTLVIDPYSTDTGLAPFRSKADIVALTNPTDLSMSHTDAVQGDPFLINTPGEYSISGFNLYALGWLDENQQERSIQLWQIESITMLHVGQLNRDLSDKELQHLEKTDIDVLFLPVGGGDGLSLKQAMKLITVIEPRIVIPIHYALPGLKESLDDVTQFAKEMGISPSDQQPKIIIKAGKLPQEDVTTYILKP